MLGMEVVDGDVDLWRQYKWTWLSTKIIDGNNYKYASISFTIKNYAGYIMNII